MGSTKQRDAIIAVFQREKRPLSPDEVRLLCREALPRIGMATVYRALRAMLESGHLCPVELPGMSPRYELAAQSHHHHFHCHSCGRTFAIPCTLGGLQALVPQGFKVCSHSITLYGRCPDCLE